MASKGNQVNLDAMIKRADFAAKGAEEPVFEKQSTISVRDFTRGGLMGPSLRKPDFQRETNHWVPDQVASLLECFVSGDLIPSVILWQSPTYLFVIDGGHRLSVLRAWVEDDYGDGPISQQMFGNRIPASQLKAAEKTRQLIKKAVGSWQHVESRLGDESLANDERTKAKTIVSRGLPIQWLNGDADKAESSFYKINTKGTPLDSVEELLLRSRKKPVSIAARAVIRAGKGHKYWSSFEPTIAAGIEAHANSLHGILFEPEITTPIKTLDLPLGGSKGVRAALRVLIDFVLIANRGQNGKPKDVYDSADDNDGSLTIAALEKSLRLAQRITGNEGGSLGLHPAVYFYGPTGRHSGPMFMGTLMLIGAKLANNDSRFFKEFTRVRSELEAALINHKELIATILQKHSSKLRVGKYHSLLGTVVDELINGNSITEQGLVDKADLTGKLLVGSAVPTSKSFSEDTKSSVFISNALESALKCPICNGYLDPEKSVSYDHIKPVRDDGLGGEENCQLTHPYCNQSVKQ